MNKLAIWPAVFLLAVLLVSAAVATMSTTGGSFGWCLTQPSTSAEPDRPAAGLDHEQADNAAVIITVGRDLGVPPRGWVIAIATALQESSLRNLPHLGADNDHDSLGLFQQRPSMGWGTPDQIQDPVYAATAFYQALLQVPDWHLLPLTEAAQAVQRSAFPDAYARHEQQATQIVNTVGSAYACALPGDLGQCVSSDGWTQPVRGVIVSRFRTVERPGHDGVDIAATAGTPICAASSGTVTVVRCNVVPEEYGCDRDGSPDIRGCGWYVDIEHGGGVVTRYCHMLTEPLVQVGQTVVVGQVIGLVGSSGNSSGPHLHFEVRLGSSLAAVDPVDFMRQHGAALG